MLRLTEITVQFPEHVHVRSDMGSAFHGILMELTSPEAAQQFHEMQLRPYSQCVYWDNAQKQAVWRIGTLTDYAYEQLIVPLQVKTTTVRLKQKHIDLGLSSVRCIREERFADLSQRFIQADAAPSTIRWQCLSPMSFRQNNRYVILPDISLIYQSLLNRWNTFSAETKLEAPKLVEELSAHCSLQQYTLRSCVFSVEASRIFGCMGMMQYRLFGYDMLKRIQGLLGAFAEFSGIGIKTALGMGAVQTSIEEEQEK